MSEYTPDSADPTTGDSSDGARLARASIADTAAVLAEVALPLVARGTIIRRPPVVTLLQRLDADARAVERMRVMRDRYGPDPVRLRIPGRELALVLSARDARRVLDQSPVPFSPANREKRAALARFQPHGALISTGPARDDRRRFNDAVLEPDQPLHHLAAPFVDRIVEETSALADAVQERGRLTWDDFVEAWFRVVRRIVLGDAARDDHAVTDMLAELRASANWSLAGRRRTDLRRRFFRQLHGHLDRAEPDSLAEVVARTPATADTDPSEQVPQWLFAFDAAAWATYRALALISTHPEIRARARDEVRGQALTAPRDHPFLRACLLESLRLYPTTPAILRDTTEETHWGTGTLPAGAGVLIFTPFFHRDPEAVADPDRFRPEVWADRTGQQLGRLADADWPLVPFSAGPVICPGRHLVLLTATTVLATLLAGPALDLDPAGRLDPARLPSVLSPFPLTFRVVGPGGLSGWAGPLARCG